MLSKLLIVAGASLLLGAGLSLNSGNTLTISLPDGGTESMVVTGSDGGPVQVQPIASSTAEALPAASPITPTANTSTVVCSSNAARLGQCEVCNVGTVPVYAARGSVATSSAYDVVLDPPQSGNKRGDCWSPSGPSVFTGTVSVYGASGIQVTAGASQ